MFEFALACKKTLRVKVACGRLFFSDVDGDQVDVVCVQSTSLRTFHGSCALFASGDFSLTRWGLTGLSGGLRNALSMSAQSESGCVVGMACALESTSTTGILRTIAQPTKG